MTARAVLSEFGLLCGAAAFVACAWFVLSFAFGA